MRSTTIFDVSRFRRCTAFVLVLVVILLEFATSFSRAQERLPGQFTAGYDLSGYPKQIAKLNIWASPYVDGNEAGGGVEISGDGRNVHIAVLWDDLGRGSIIAVRNRLIRITNLRYGVGTKRSEIDFETVDEKSLLTLISPEPDTLFFPVGGHINTGYCHADVFISPTSTAANPQATVKFHKQQDQTLPKIAPVLKDAQLTQVVAAGDILRYGNRGLKVRRVVPPDAERKIVGWVELFDKELKFED